MFTVFVGSILTTCLGAIAFRSGGEESPAFILGVSAWLWFTVLFANFAEAMADGRGKAQADSLRATNCAMVSRRVEHVHRQRMPDAMTRVSNKLIRETTIGRAAKIAAAAKARGVEMSAGERVAFDALLDAAESLLQESIPRSPDAFAEYCARPVRNTIFHGGE